MFNYLEPLSRVYEKVHDSVDEWNKPAQIANHISSVAERVVYHLNKVPGMTHAHSRDFKNATPYFTMSDGSVIKIFINPVGVKHVFVADSDGNMTFGGFVMWMHTDRLNDTLALIERKFTLFPTSK